MRLAEDVHEEGQEKHQSDMLVAGRPADGHAGASVVNPYGSVGFGLTRAAAFQVGLLVLLS